MGKEFKIIQFELLLAEKNSDKRIKVRMKESDKKLMMKILKKDFRIINQKEVME